MEQTFVDSIKSLSANDFMEVIAFAGKTGSTLLTILMGFDLLSILILIEAEKLARYF